MLDLSRRVDKGDRRSLEQCALHLARLGEFAFAADCYARLGDTEQQLAVYVEAKQWEEAFALVEQHRELKVNLYLPYAQWLAEHDKFEEAQAGELFYALSHANPYYISTNVVLVKKLEMLFYYLP
ncbi:unnamed protein product [Protopolystoma xenopodis]|uniref:Intraflagellar transport protein 122 homolog TPR domain-containing protein n=1 Tax=Protopolystoma xenopodis TaxID=117903 RepID=A0A3S5A1N4_9PLAT|nr:unnamed protein product [Protopolystoma xenopodis]